MAVIGREAARAPLTSADINDGIVGAADLQSTLDLSSKTITLGTPTANGLTVSPSSGDATLTLTSNASQPWEVYSPDSSNDLRFKSDSTDYVTIDTSGNFGIGTTSIDLTSSGRTVVQVEGSSNALLNLTDGTSRLYLHQKGGTSGADIWNNANSYMRFATNDTERMRINSSGNILVGTTDADLGYTDGDSGVVINGDGPIQAARDSANAIVYLNKLNNDGPIIQMHKDGTTVGNISTVASNIAIGKDDTALYISAATDSLTPTTLTSGVPVERDGGIDIGRSSARFKDLYLSGGAYLGGTGSANYLDDYEEGTHNTTVSFTSGSVTLSANTLVYTKIGRQVIVTGYVSVSGTSSPSGIMRFTLPFPVASGAQYRAAANVKFNQLLSGENITTAAWAIAEQNTSTVAVYGGSGNSVDTGTGARIATNTDFRVSVSYTTSA